MLERVALERPRPAMPEAHAAVVRIVERSAHDRADHRIESGAVSPTGQDADAYHLAAAYETRAAGSRRSRESPHAAHCARVARCGAFRTADPVGRADLPQVHSVLENPVYAGAYAFGKTRRKRYVDEHGQPRKRMRRLPQAEWEVLIWEHHPASSTRPRRGQPRADRCQHAPARTSQLATGP